MKFDYTLFWATFCALVQEIAKYSTSTKHLAEKATREWLNDINDVEKMTPDIVHLLLHVKWMPPFVKAFHENDSRVVNAINKVRSYWSTRIK